ncbi:pleckstrin homology domain-containing family F member 2 [Aplysia californica]|uniref:Pleckstrin homology domain-containing family F member 2 n=1 Tax=Aplysia californica TaxID=6500 RepID=A0ABM0ZVD2_APLCA|nr:pleckstrin homology domain-containing family F member 2 [Aplysia californica]
MVDRLVNSEANARRINNVEQCFGSSGQPLGIPGRVLVGEGVLTKMCRKKPKPRQFFLFNDALVYGNIIIHKKKYNKQHILPLEEVKLENVEDEGGLRNGWKLKSPSKSFVVFAATATEKKEWMAHIRKCVNDLLAKRGIRQSTTNDSPVWVPDSEAKTCMHCRKSEFSLVNRRHHCRHCGRVVCNACSSKRWLLPQQSSKPIRVCLTCYHKLSGEAADSNVSRTYAVIATGENRNSSGEDSSDDDDDQGRDGLPPAGQSGGLDIHDAHFQSYN